MMTDKLYRRYFITFTAHSKVKNENYNLGVVFEMDEDILNGHQIDSLGAFMTHHNKMECKVNGLTFLGMAPLAKDGEGVIRLVRKEDEEADKPESPLHGIKSGAAH